MIDLKELTLLVGELEEEDALDLLTEYMNSNPTQEHAEMVLRACQEGMEIVGDLFEKGEYFVGDLIFAGELLKGAINILKPAIGVGSSSAKIGKIVIGTVHGDLHDIGKNIFVIMSEAAGFEVHDLGIDQPVRAFVDKVKEVNPDIIGLSGVITLALGAMKDTVEGLKEAGVKDDFKIIIGGNPVTHEACEHIGADAFTTNATEGVKICKKWVRK
ncbi:MAG: cobalamin B12-binding domain-containing protein [Eubacteriaceae bacterium]